MTGPKLYVAGNWKMNGVQADLKEIESVKDGVTRPGPMSRSFRPRRFCIQRLRWLRDRRWKSVRKTATPRPKGAFTGDLSAAILKDAGASAVIVGHSERRSGHGETSRDVHAKASAALKAGLKVIVCIGETKGERIAGLAPDVCARQLAAAFPLKAPRKPLLSLMNLFGRSALACRARYRISPPFMRLFGASSTRFPASAGKRWRVLYGGSVTAANAASIFESNEVDGVLVGGASLKAASFLAIIAAAKAASELRPGRQLDMKSFAPTGPGFSVSRHARLP